MVKFGAAFAGAGSGVILSVIGFDQSVELQSTDTLLMLRLSYIIIPCVGTFLAILVMRNYDLDEQKANEIRAQLDARRAEQSAT
jgi:GPH family glycoside/pentoside/hexuronide:cation symporter